MSSSSAFLAYVLDQQEPIELLALRIAHAERHVQRLHRGRLTRTSVGDGGSGFVGWVAEDYAVGWQPYLARDGAGVAWLHVPSVAGGPGSGVDEWELAEAVLSGRSAAGSLASPFAVVRWADGQLDIVNDMLGLVRLFHFRFDGGEVWTTRPGLAHVFMGERPRKNRLAWAGMATLGWATSGSTQLGEGNQLRGGSRVRGRVRSGRGVVEVENHLAEWLGAARAAPEPSPARNVRDMESLMATAKRWPGAVTADLSGGKDSRVVVAVGIRSGAVRSVRTIATDHGEVETAERLISLLDGDVEHRIVPRKDPSVPGGSFVDRVGSQHRAWEGRYLATTTYGSPAFTGFRHRRAPTFNGLGGEVMAGGNLLGAWHDRLIDAPGPAARDKLATMVNVARAASAEAREMTIADIEGYVSRAGQLGVDGAAGVMDVFYDLDKMPNWSITYSSPHTLTPLFAPSLLAFAAQRAGNPLEYGAAHRRLLREAVPPWAEVPFYKPTALKRAMPFVWENSDWPEIRRSLVDHREQADSFDPDAVAAVLALVDEGTATKREEIVIQRFLWELTFDACLDEVAAEAAATAAALSATRRVVHEAPADRRGLRSVGQVVASRFRRR